MNNIVSVYLKTYFREQGITQQQIADILGSTQPIVGKLLNGKSFGKNTAAKWSSVFGFNPAWLITGEGEIMLSDKLKTEDSNNKNDTGENEIKLDNPIDLAKYILDLVTKGELIPASVIKEKDNIIRLQSEEISKLNKELLLMKECNLLNKHRNRNKRNI